MAQKDVLSFQIISARDAAGRFARASAELTSASLDEAARLAVTLTEVYREWAPRSSPEASRTGIHFRDSFSGLAEPNSSGFSVKISTNQGQLAEWLRQGTGVWAGHGRIYPKRAKALGPIFNWVGGTGPNWFRSIRGMPANPWEDLAFEDSKPLVEQAAKQIGSRVGQVYGRQTS